MIKKRFHRNDLPHLNNYAVKDIAIDVETLGLNIHRDRLCLVQLSSGDSSADIIQIEPNQTPPKNLITLLQESSITKIFHFARFDLASLYYTFHVMPSPIFCTKIASRLVRTYTDKHSLKELCKEFLNIDLSKFSQCSDWGAENFSEEQLNYAASDVIYLHKLKDILLTKLVREKRILYAEECFRFLPTRVELDILGWDQQDIFSH